MRGLSKGEQSTLESPRLALFARSGGFLVDIYSGSYKIEDISRLTGDPIERKASTEINTTADRVGVGRYVLLTGETATWSYGTHRAVVTFKLSATGPTHTQVIEFEVLDPADWVNGQSYIGYASTRRLYADKYVLEAKQSRQSLHRLIKEYSNLVNQWTGRLGFHPVYTSLRIEGGDSENLLLDEAIIAIEQITDSYGNIYEAANYRVFNRHLDNGPDDRYNPAISRFVTETQDGRVRVMGAWPRGHQNLVVVGLFGFTDPEAAEDTAERVSLGVTPDDLIRVIGVLITRRIADPLMNDPTVQSPGNIRSARTRDQAVSMGGAATATDGQGSMTGDPILDQILVRYARPVFAAYVGSEERAIAPWRPWP